MVPSILLKICPIFVHTGLGRICSLLKAPADHPLPLLWPWSDTVIVPNEFNPRFPVCFQVDEATLGQDVMLWMIFYLQKGDINWLKPCLCKIHTKGQITLYSLVLITFFDNFHTLWESRFCLAQYQWYLHDFELSPYQCMLPEKEEWSAHQKWDNLYSAPGQCLF